MSDPGSGEAMRTDLHLKPLDNAALLKPLRKAPEPIGAVSPAPVKAAPEPPAASNPPVVKMTPPAARAPVDDDDDDDDDIPAARPVPQHAAKPAPQPVIQRAPRTQTRPAPVPEEEEDDEPAAGAYAAAQRPEHSYRPTDEQVHMMELMKSIFASALNAGLQAGEPPQIPVPEPEPPSMDDLRKTLIALQQKIREAKIPVVIVIDGLSASGKGTMLSRLIEGLDPRGYKTHPIRRPNCVEADYPAMWRYWTAMPRQGDISLFCSSWYGELNKASLDRSADVETLLPRRLNEIISMESQLICDGTLILKFFLHISQQEQYDRLKKLEKKKSTAWLVDEHDHEQNRRYDEYMKGMDDLMSITNLKAAPWHVLDAADMDGCERQMFQTVIQAFGDALAERAENLRAWDVPMLPNLSPIPSLGFPPPGTIDLNKTLDSPYAELHRELKKKLAKLQIKLYRRGIPMVVAFEGWDAAGKGGAIRRLTGALDARGFTVAPVSAPTPTELSHHYMWRFWTALPPRGHITIFDRTWYGRVMVERIEKLCTVPQWQRAYEEINRFEKLLTDDGAILCKFWLQIDQAEQLKRFEARKGDPEKQWKITDEDWRNREKWPAYEQALNEVLQRTHTSYAPWTVVEANDKEYARIKVLKTVIDAMEKRLHDHDGEDDD